MQKTIDPAPPADGAGAPEVATLGEWLSIGRVAERLDVRVDHLRALVARGEIPFGRVGRLVRFHWPTVEQWVKESAEPKAAPAAVAAARVAR